MSAPTTIAFFGLRLELCEDGQELSDDDIESLEDRSHPAIIKARKAGLQYDWGNFGEPGELYFLFIGKSLGRLGIEDSSELSIGLERLAQIAAEVTSKLSVAGFIGHPTLLLQFRPDA